MTRFFSANNLNTYLPDDLSGAPNHLIFSFPRDKGAARNSHAYPYFSRYEQSYSIYTK